MEDQLREEIAGDLLSHCFIVGTQENQRKKYYEVLNNEEEFRRIFDAVGYEMILHKNLKVVQLKNKRGQGRVELKKYESILLLLLRMLYLEKRESLESTQENIILRVEELIEEYDKLQLPRKLDQDMLTKAVRTFRKYHLALPLDKLNDVSARLLIFPSVMLALPDALIEEAYEQTKEQLTRYEEVG